MDTNTEEQLKQMLKQVETSADKIKLITNSFRVFYGRLEDIAVCHKRRQPVTDISFEKEFRSAVDDLKKFTDDAEEFWQNARKDYYGNNKAEAIRENRVVVKQITIAAMDFTRRGDELFTLYKNMQETGKEVPLRLNWWVLEYCCETIQKTTGRILFMTRDMEKHYE